MPTPPYTCTGFEKSGDVELINADGEVINCILSSRCFADWYCPQNELTWRWRDGIDPDDPSTWPPAPEDPPPTP